MFRARLGSPREQLFTKHDRPPKAMVCPTSGQDLPDRSAVVDIQPLAARHFQAPWVEAQLVQDRGVDVGDVVPVLDGVESYFIGSAVDHAPLDAPACQP